MSAHTPGPWRMDHAGAARFEIFGRGIAENRMYLGTWVPATTVQEQRDAISANARLIAAAPDLLAALKAVMDGQFGGRPDMDAERFRLADAAIAKAEGVTHPENCIECGAPHNNGNPPPGGRCPECAA